MTKLTKHDRGGIFRPLMLESSIELQPEGILYIIQETAIR